MSFADYLKNECSYEDLIGLWNVYATEKFPKLRIYGSVEEYCAVFKPDALTLASLVVYGDLKSMEDDLYIDDKGRMKGFDNLENSPIDVELLAHIMEERDAFEYRYWVESGTLEE